MPIIYRYIHVPRKDGTLRHAPFIPVIVRNKFEQVMKVVGLVDSGADTTVVPRDLADLLGMKENAASTETGGIGGKVKVKRSRLRFMLEGNRERYSLDVTALILQDNDNDVPLLLGRHGFFEHFHITFKQDEQKVVLKRINPKEIY